MSTTSVGPSSVGSYVDVDAELTQIITNSLRQGDLAYSIASDTYWRFSPTSVDAVGANVVYADIARGGLAAGRWIYFARGTGLGLNVDYQTVGSNGQTAFVIPVLPLGDLVMQVNGRTQQENVDWTRAGLNVTWLNTFVLQNTPGPADVVTFICVPA